MKLRDYQEKTSTEAAQTIKEYGLAYLSWECRIGKSITGLVTAQKYGAKRVLFLTKKKAINSVLKDYKELQKSTVPFELQVLNHESSHKATINPDFIILDEAHAIGAYPRPCKKAISIKEISKGLPVLFMSGTPTPESYSQLFHQFWISDNSPFSEYPTFYKWAKDYVITKQKKVNGFTITDYSNAMKRKIDKAVNHLFYRYTQEEAGFRCDIEEIDLLCPMKDEISKLLKTLKRDKVIYLSNGEVVLADTPANLLNKMHQISGGTVITSEGVHLILDYGKAKFIRNYFKGKKLAIFYVYQTECELLKKIFPNNTESPEEFQSSTDKTFISQIRKAREGIRLDTADAIVFYSLEYSYLSYEQGRNRIVSKERTTPAKVYFAISEKGIERDILKAVRSKKDFTLSWYYRHHS